LETGEVERHRVTKTREEEIYRLVEEKERQEWSRDRGVLERGEVERHRVRERREEEIYRLLDERQKGGRGEGGIENRDRGERRETEEKRD
jgi:hypothetical protein